MSDIILIGVVIRHQKLHNNYPGLLLYIIGVYPLSGPRIISETRMETELSLNHGNRVLKLPEKHRLDDRKYGFGEKKRSETPDEDDKMSNYERPRRTAISLTLT